MRSITGRNGWLSHSIAVTAAILVAGLQVLISPPFGASPAWAGYELPPGERITNLPHIPRSMPQKEAYETYDPVIGRNFDIKNFWLRADLRVRPEFRNGVCFGGGPPVGGSCTTQQGARQNGPAFSNGGGQSKGANDFYVQQWVRLGIGYDLSPDVNFYMELI
ncbi:MAG: alginate export family protein, partial [Candidatus Methylomirabilis sp.]